MSLTLSEIKRVYCTTRKAGDTIAYLNNTVLTRAVVLMVMPRADLLLVVGLSVAVRAWLKVHDHEGAATPTVVKITPVSPRDYGYEAATGWCG